MSFQLQNSEVLARLKPFGISFEKSLSDLIKGIRANSKESSEALSTYLNAVILECKNELQTTDIETKASAILKLTYLEMYGFDMSWSNFQILEVMSSNKFQQKRIGYLAAIQSFKNELDLLVLATNQFKKDLNSSNHIEIGLALSGIATIVTPNLSKDINDDVLVKLNHTNPYIRKKAILAMFKIFLQYPESLKLNFGKIIERLDDSDLSVVSATINVICEISKKQPKIFINYLPKFFEILQDSKNNWLIIRILKLFQSLSKVEPRIKKKIIPIIMDLMMKTMASSLIYECINCISSGTMLDPTSSKDKETAKICIKKLMEFFKTNDSNLKFVGLIALINLVKTFPGFIKTLDGVSDVIMDCLNDNDLIIKRKALEICHYLVDDNNLVDLVKVLLLQLVPNETFNLSEGLKEEIVFKIIQISGQGNYELIPNFKWYVAVLKDIMNLTLKGTNIDSTTSKSNLTSNESHASMKISNQLGQEFKNLATKVPSIRSLIINKVIVDSIQDVQILESHSPLLKDFYWIMGEYINEISSEENEDEDEEDEDEEEPKRDDSNAKVLNLGKKLEILNTVVNTKIDQELSLSTNARFPISKRLIDLDNPDVLIVLVQAIVKLFNGIVSDYISLYSSNNKLSTENYHQLSYYLYKVIEFLSVFENHANYEVQERALSWLEFLKLLLEALTNGDLKEILRLREEEIEYYKNIKSNDESDSQEEDDDEEEEDEDDEDEEDSDDDDEDDEEESDDNGITNRVHKESDEKSKEVLLDTDIELKSNPFSDEVKESLLETSGDSNENGLKDLPVLLTHILPSFFNSYQLNPIAKNAQRNISLPEDLDLETQINEVHIPLETEVDPLDDQEYNLYLTDEESENENNNGSSLLSSENSSEDLKKKQERLERMKDDPYYITSKSSKKNKAKTTKSSLLKETTPDSETGTRSALSNMDFKTKTKPKKMKKEKVVILSEETVGETPNLLSQVETITPAPRKKKNVLKIDSSNLDNFDLNSNSVESPGPAKEFEYEIDLEEIRRKLAETSVEEKKPKKKSSKKDKEGKEKKEGKSSKTKKVKSEQSQTLESNGLAERASPVEKNGSVEKDVNTKSVENGSDTTVVAVKKPKKTKKKKAVIVE